MILTTPHLMSQTCLMRQNYGEMIRFDHFLRGKSIRGKKIKNSIMMKLLNWTEMFSLSNDTNNKK